MQVRVLAFARLRELLGGGSHLLDVQAGSTALDVWNVLADRCSGLRELAESTRFACNGRLVNKSEPLSEGDEVALLPPVGGG